MKQFQTVIKYLATAFACFLIAMIFYLIYQGGMFLGDGVLGYGSKEVSEFRIEDFASDTAVLKIDLRAGKLALRYGEELSVKTNNKKVTTKQIGNKLSVVEKKSNLFSSKHDHEIIVTIPRDLVFEEVVIASGAGKVDVEGLTAKKLTLELGAGKSTLRNLNVSGKAKIDAGAGSAKFSNANLNNLSLDMGVGKVEFEGILTGSNDIDAGVGGLTLSLGGAKSNYQIDVDTGIGSVTIDGKRMKNEMTYGKGATLIDLDGGVGSTEVSFQD